MRQCHDSNPEEDMIDYPVSEAFWRDAYRQGLTPHRPPDLPFSTMKRKNLETESLYDRIEALEAKIRTLTRALRQAQPRPTAHPTCSQVRPSETPRAVKRGGRVYIPRVES